VSVGCENGSSPIVAERDQPENALSGSANFLDRHKRLGREPGIDVLEAADSGAVANSLAQATIRTVPRDTPKMRAQKLTKGAITHAKIREFKKPESTTRIWLMTTHCTPSCHSSTILGFV